MHVGEEQTIGGREGAGSTAGLSGTLQRLGFELRRLKTGTPPRLRAGSIDFNRLEPQSGDDDPQPFSFRTDTLCTEQVLCHLAYTNARTKAVINENLHRSPLFGGIIAGQGPRYCPSIEDKVVRFADKERHLLFLEPEGLTTDEIYVNGLSTSLPADVQQRMVHSIPGLEGAELCRYGYAVEYDSVPSYQVNIDLQTKRIAGLYLAGQIIGTSGYEEAAAQGLLAGINAARSLEERPVIFLERSQAYLGVLVDDLVTKDISEPYRMFTSRAEHRLELRCDNVESRLCDVAMEVELLGAKELALLQARRGAVRTVIATLQQLKIKPAGEGDTVSAADFMRRPRATLADLEAIWPGGGGSKICDMVTEAMNGGNENRYSNYYKYNTLNEIENELKYAGYIHKHRKLLRSQAHLDNLNCPVDMDYLGLAALSNEAREKLDRIRPATLGQASRIDGVRAGDLAVLTVVFKRLLQAKGSG